MDYKGKGEGKKVLGILGEYHNNSKDKRNDGYILFIFYFKARGGIWKPLLIDMRTDNDMACITS